MPARPTPHRSRPLAAAALAGLLVAGHALGQDLKQPVAGFLCCNMLSDGRWISDINYVDSSMQLVPAGTPLRHTGYGRWRMLVEIDGKKLAIGNDYSRTIKMEEFAQRYLVAEDPRPALQDFPPKVREAIQARKLLPGMTRQQVLMAIGYPITSYNPDLDAPLWRYWLDRSSEFQVFWGDDGRVDKVFGPAEVRSRIVLE